ncbi:MAG: tetratricopeptide repeat protein [Geobacteraceae bacterium]|nr:tetratricopeptide repeat protein [Geobacteraceae bacterium]
MKLTLCILVFSLAFQASLLFANEPFALNEYAISLMQKGEHDKALEQLQKAYGMYPYDQVLKKNLAEAYTFVGQRQLKENNFDAAAASFDRARELFPDIPRYYVMRGIALYYGKYPDAAQNELERARGLGGDAPEILYYLAKIQYDVGNLAAAVDFLEKAVIIKPDFKTASEMIEKLKRELTVEKSMDKGYSSKFVISYDAESKSHLAGDILSSLEDAYSNVGRDLSFFPTGRITVIVYTKKDFKSVTAGPDWSGGLYDGKIRLPVGGTQELTDQLKSVLAHEYTHVVVQEMTHGNCPTWLNEGLAEIQGRKLFNPAMQQLGKAARGGKYVSFKELEDGFTSLESSSAALAYQQSYSLANFMVAAYGWPKIIDILNNLGTGMKISDAMKKSMADFGLDYDGVIEEWRSYMKREFGSRSSE